MIVAKLREAEVFMAKGQTIEEVMRRVTNGAKNMAVCISTKPYAIRAWKKRTNACARSG